MHCREEHLRAVVHHTALNHADLPWPPPEAATSRREAWWSNDKTQQARNRGIYHGLRLMSLCVINRLIGEAIDAAADQDAIRAARRFHLRRRERIYRAAATSRRALQLTDTFPVAALALYANEWPSYPNSGWTQVEQQRTQRQRDAKSLVERGARLRDVAAALGLPMALRHVKPGAAHLVTGVFVDRPELLQYMPSTTPAAWLWLKSVHYAQSTGGADYATWVARHEPEIPRQQAVRTVTDMKDWVLANKGKSGQQFVTRRFNPAMGWKAAIQASHDWHEAVAANMDCADGGALPAPWYQAAKAGAFEIIPITTTADLVREGHAMHHCVGTYADNVRAGSCYVFSVRQNGERVATVSLVRHHSEQPPLIDQIRGPCNSEPSKAVISAVRRWLRSQPVLKQTQRPDPIQSRSDLAPEWSDELAETIPF